MSADDLFARLAGLTARVNRTIQDHLEEDQGFFGEVGVYSLLGGGKRLRPLIYCLSLGALGVDVDEGALKRAAGFELIHMATLMHDDIIDQSDLRRGRSAAHMIFGIPETVMAADYLMAQAGLLTVADSDQAAIRLLLELLRDLSLGELAELKATRRTDLPLAEYMRIIHLKTASLIEAVCRLAALAAGADERAAKALADYGRLMGLSFQITDDALDYRSRSGTLGKPVGQDLAEGKITLPFILARDTLTGAERERLELLGAEDPLSAESLAEAKGIVEGAGGLELSLAKARELGGEAAAALEVLPPSKDRDLLAELAIYAAERDR